MGRFDRGKDAAAGGEGGAAPTPPEAPPLEESIEIIDSLGRRTRVPRSRFIESVLRPRLEAHRDDPDGLAVLVSQAVGSGVAAEALEAARRLVEIDPHPARARVLLGAALIAAGNEAEGEAALRAACDEGSGESGGEWRGLAQLELARQRDRRGDEAGADAALDEAVRLAPNHEPVLARHLARARRSGGEDGERAALEALAARPEAWRARLERARLDLQAGAKDAARERLRAVLDAFGDNAEAQFLVASSLAVHGEHDAAIELVAPRLDPERLDPRVGLQILRSFLVLKRWQPAASMLHAVAMRAPPELAAEIARLTAEFDRLELEELRHAPPRSPHPIRMNALLQPIGWHGLHDPAWLAPEKAAGARDIAFFPLRTSLAGNSAAAAVAAVIARGIPLFLAEQVWMETPQRGAVVIPWAASGAYAALDDKTLRDDAALLAFFPAPVRERVIAVTGRHLRDGEGDSIELELLDARGGRRLPPVRARAAAGRLDELARRLDVELRRALGAASVEPFAAPPGFLPGYASGLAQLAGLVLAQPRPDDPGFVPARVFGERNVLRWLLELAAAPAAPERAHWLACSALALGRARGSDVPLELAPAFAELFRRAPATSALARLAGVPLRALGLTELWRARRDEILAAAPPACAAWSRRLEGVAS